MASDSLASQTPGEGTSEMIQMLEQGAFMEGVEEGEDEFEEMEDENEEMSDSESNSEHLSSEDSYGSDDLSDPNDLSSHHESRGSFNGGMSDD